MKNTERYPGTYQVVSFIKNHYVALKFNTVRFSSLQMKKQTTSFELNWKAK